MRALVRRAADKLVDKVAPRVVADAACMEWGNYCYCRNSYLYYLYYFCDGTAKCVARYGPVGCP